MAGRRTSSQSILRSLASDPIAPVYLFHGEEPYLIDQAVAAIMKRVAGDAPSSFDVDSISFAEMTPAEVLARACAYPMSAEKRVVVARDVEKVLGKPGGKTGDDRGREGENKGGSLKPLMDFIASPLETTCLMLTAGKKLDGRLKAVKDLQDRGAAYEFMPLYESEVPAWITDHVRAAGRSVDDDASQLLAAYVGSSLFDISSEIEKLLIYTAGKPSISTEDVATLVGVSREYNVFELQRAVASRNLGKSLSVLEHMMDAGQSGPYLTTVLTGYFTRIWKLHALTRRLRDEKKIMEEMEVAPFVFRELRGAAENYPAAEIGRAFASLLEADLRLKSGGMEQRSTLDALLIQLIAGGSVS
jgi:DNA polymerase III subunit delta